MPQKLHRNQTKNKNHATLRNIPITAGNITIKSGNIIVTRQKQQQHQRPIKYDIRELTCESYLIAILITCGYENYELAQLLHELFNDTHITACTRDIFILLTTAHVSAFNTALNKLGIDIAISICDELCAPCIINKIINANIMLSHISSTQIINHYIADNELVTAYSIGYRLVPYTSKMIFDESTPISTINNAINNGLYAIDLTLHVFDSQKIIDYDIIDGGSDAMLVNIENNFSEIKNLEISLEQDSSKSSVDNDILLLCTPSVEKICICCKDIENIDDILCYIADYMSHITTFVIRDSVAYFETCMIRHIPNLHTLYIDNNCYITTCGPSAKSLRVLHANGRCCKLVDAELSRCIQLSELYISDNDKITSCNSLAKTLRVLDISLSKINDSGINLCTRLVQLCICDNYNITTCEPFAKTLRVLDATDIRCTWKCHDGRYIRCIGDNGLTSCTRLRELYASGNQYITTCRPFANSLVILYADTYMCGIRNASINGCTKLRMLSHVGNNKIACIKHDPTVRPRSKFECRLIRNPIYF